MLRGLRARLFASYLFLLMLTLGVIAAAVVLILNTRPAPPQPTYQQLAAIASSLPLRQIWEETGGQFLLPQQRLNALIEALGQHAAERDLRVLLVNSDTRAVLYDSAGQFTENDRLSGAWQTYPVPAPLGRMGMLAVRLDAVAGSFINPDDGAEWLYVGLESLGVRGNDYILLFASPRPTQSLQAALSEFGTELFPLLVQAAILGLVVALVLAVVISRSIAQPLQRLAVAAEEVANGKFAQRLPVSGPKEIAAVAEAFNRMSEEVRAEKAAQKDFLANVSHDLKTPLTSIQGFSQAIVDGAAPDPIKAAQIIYDEAARLNRMVVELTELARLEAGRLSLHMSPIDMGQLTEAIAQRLAIVARQKRITFNVDAPSMPPISGDGDRLAQVLTNLISNAIQYTPEGGQIDIRTRVRESGVEIIVQDTGVGISAQDLPRIFERFYQVDKARGPRRGTGLGLAIVQEIVQAHGGRVTAASAGEGRGSTFTVWLPIAQVNGALRKRTDRFGAQV